MKKYLGTVLHKSKREHTSNYTVVQVFREGKSCSDLLDIVFVPRALCVGLNDVIEYHFVPRLNSFFMEVEK